MGSSAEGVTRVGGPVNKNGVGSHISITSLQLPQLRRLLSFKKIVTTRAVSAMVVGQWPPGTFRFWALVKASSWPALLPLLCVYACYAMVYKHAISWSRAHRLRCWSMAFRMRSSGSSGASSSTRKPSAVVLPRFPSLFVCVHTYTCIECERA